LEAVHEVGERADELVPRIDAAGDGAFTRLEDRTGRLRAVEEGGQRRVVLVAGGGAGVAAHRDVEEDQPDPRVRLQLAQLRLTPAGNEDAAAPGRVVVGAG